MMHENHVWSYDFMTAGHSRMLNIIDEYKRECRDITVEKKITAHQGIERLANLFIMKSIPEHIRSDNGPEFTAKAVRT
jgi:putative transposase